MNRRIVYILGVFTCLLAVILFRTAYLQLWEGPNSGSALAAKALKYRSQVIAGEEYYRGEILDRNFISLTDSGVRYTLVAFPASIRQPAETVRQVEETISLPAEQTALLIKRGQEVLGLRSPLLIKINLTSAEAEALRKANITGLAVLPVKTRYGPGAVACHLIGYLNKISESRWQELLAEKKTADSGQSLPTAYRITDSIGTAGLEAKYEEVLRGSKPERRILAISDANGRILEGLGFKVRHEPADTWRNHLVLTLDKRYQEIVEQVMAETVARGAVVVLDVASGDVLAAASCPTFDQNQVSKYLTGYDELIDRTERVAFYPGSVFKMVVAAAVLEEGLVGPDERFNCTGRYTFSDGTEIRCLHEHGSVNLVDAISKSCNTTFVQLGQRLGGQKLAEYAAKLGFAITITSSSPPALVGNASIGQQGALVSPMQIANLYATIARNGYYRPSRLIAQIRNSQGDVIHEYPGLPALQAVSRETCAALKEALAIAARTGSASPGWVRSGGVAGKTGTAQVSDNNKVIAWFAGFTPVENPRLAIAVMVEEDVDGVRTGLRGGETAGPIFKQIAEEILKLEGIPLE